MSNNYDIKQADQKYPYIDKIGIKFDGNEIKLIEKQYNLTLLSIKTISENKTRYGFKKNESN